MKKTVLLIAAGLIWNISNAQITTSHEVENPISWSQEFWVAEDGIATITFHAALEKGWHLYSQHIDPEKIGPIPTTFTFKEAEFYERMGAVEEGETIVVFDPNFEMEIAMFEDSAIFEQKVRLKEASGIVKGNISFMVCNDEQCIFPPEYEFVVNIVPPTSKK